MARKMKHLESFMLSTADAGESFISNRSTNVLTGLADYYNRKITTEKMIVISAFKKELSTEFMTKVVIIK